MFFVVRELVGIEEFGDRRIFGFLFFVQVENPFQGGAVAKTFASNPSGFGQSAAPELLDGIRALLSLCAVTAYLALF